MKKIPRQFFKNFTRLAVAEDAVNCDLTTELLIPKNLTASAVLVIKENGVVAGLPVVRAVLKEFDPGLNFKPLVKEGSLQKKGRRLAYLSGPARSILSIERILLNILQKLSGIATLTRKFVKQVKGYPVKILDTRKTNPGLRWLEKYAVAVGGGINHRFNLAEAVLVKDNHLALVSFEKIVRTFGKPLPLTTEIEVKNLTALKKIIQNKLKFNRMMLDNMSPAEMKKAVSIIRKNNPTIKIEASGRVNLNNVRKIAATGVDYISIGALTHSAQFLDISLEII
jgi:nicotinate-nucleotide pyrophosphorylase (carboxylating)